MEATEAIAPLMDDGWVARGHGASGRRAGRRAPGTIRARYVIAADGAASRFAKPAGVRRDESRPLGIAARRYYRTDYHPGPWLESWLDLWDGDLLLPGYGWLFPVAGGRINLGAGLLNTFKNFKDVSRAAAVRRVRADAARRVGLDEETAEGRLLSGPLPMGLNRTPQAVPGLLLIGDAAGAVNPFNGEGIAYAMETGGDRRRADPRGARARPPGPRVQLPAGPARHGTGGTSRSAAEFARSIGQAAAIMGGRRSTCCRTRA